jgi:hypothetical protein
MPDNAVDKILDDLKIEMPKILLSRLKLRLPDEDDDALLTSLLLEAGEKILVMTNRKKVPQSLEYAQIQLALNAYNRMGLEGISRQTEGPVTVEFDETPKDLEKLILSKRLLMGE